MLILKEKNTQSIALSRRLCRADRKRFAAKICMNYLIAYYKANKLNKAIEGFKQLSGKEDSLSQHAMYLLGDSYLKTDQKVKCKKRISFLRFQQQQSYTKGNFKISICQAFL